MLSKTHFGAPIYPKLPKIYFETPICPKLPKIYFEAPSYLSQTVQNLFLLKILMALLRKLQI